MTHDEYIENQEFLKKLIERKSKAEGSIETRNDSIKKIEVELNLLKEKCKNELNVNPSDLKTEIENLKAEFNLNMNKIKEELDKIAGESEE
jgi:predicted nuclease with TOPRIM domain